ncbi:transposase IS605 family, IS200 group, partial [Escherichia coli O104:H4 str. LB226692]
MSPKNHPASVSHFLAEAFHQADMPFMSSIISLSILRKLCEWKSVRILEAECCADHIHMLVEIPPKMSVSGFMGYLKESS